MNEIKNALLPKSEDKRDFKLGVAFNLPKLSELPYEFDLGVVNILDQKQTNFCTAFAAAGALWLQEGVPLVPEFIYAATSKVTGGVSTMGYELRDCLKAQVKIGAIEEKDRPQGYRVGEKDEAFLADPDNWSVELFDKALEHAQSSYVEVDGPYDHFDNIRASIYLFRKEKRAVRFGVRWSWDTNVSYINDVVEEGGGHALYAKGWKGNYLIVPNSYGTNVGDKGVFYMHRNVVNRWVKLYGAYMTVDMTKEEYLKRLAERQNKYSTVSKILSLIAKALELIGIQLTKKVEEVKTLDEILIPMPESKLFTLAKETLGKDASPRDLVSDGVGCAESVSTLIKKIVPTFPILTGTWSIYDALKGSKYFTPVLEATLTAGDIILCATGMGNGIVKNGHVGIVGDDLKIMSNNSKTGIWEYNFTLQSWKDYFVKKGGYKLYCYRLKT